MGFLGQEWCYVDHFYPKDDDAEKYFVQIASTYEYY